MSNANQRWRRKADLVLRTLYTVDWRRDGLRFGQILLFAMSVPLLMRLKLPRLSRLLDARQRASLPNDDQIQQIVRCTEAVLALGRPLVQPRCLTRGLTLYTFLRRAGLPVELHFGVSHVTDALSGHCWLVLHGTPFAEPATAVQHFTRVCHLPIAR